MDERGDCKRKQISTCPQRAVQEQKCKVRRTDDKETTNEYRHDLTDACWGLRISGWVAGWCFRCPGATPDSALMASDILVCQQANGMKELLEPTFEVATEGARGLLIAFRKGLFSGITKRRVVHVSDQDFRSGHKWRLTSLTCTAWLDMGLGPW